MTEPKVEIIRHDQLDEAQRLARTIQANAVEGPELADTQKRVGEAADSGNFACLIRPHGPYEFQCKTIVDTPSGPVVAVGYTRAQAKRRMHRAYLVNLEHRKVGKDREERLLIAARAKFFCADLD